MMKETLFNQQSQTTKLLQLLTLFMMLFAPKGVWSQVVFDGGGNGTADSPYKIKTATDVLRISTLINDGTLEGDEYFVLDDDLMHVDCQNLQGFNPIGTTEHPFKGVLDGRGIGFVDLVYNSSESTGYSGLFGVIDGGTVKNLRLARCTFTGGTYSGAIVGYLKDGLIDNCFVTTCTVTTGNASSVAAGGVAGWAAKGTINDCKVYYGTGTTISGVSTATGTAGASNVGGIVGLAGTGGAVTISSCLVTGVPLLSKLSETERLYAGGILGNRNGNNSIVLSGNKVSNGTTVSCQSVDDNDGITFYCGAIVGYLGNTTNATLTNNTYEYNVTTSTKKGNDDANEKEGYDQRGTGVAIDIQGVIYFDIEENDGAVLYTKKLTMPEDSQEGTVELDLERGEYYDYASEGNAILFAPGQPVMLTVTPGENRFVSAISVTYGTNQVAEIEFVQTEDGVYYYTLNEMPDADATLNVTFEQIEYYDITVAGVAVTNANAADITGDGTVTFTPANNETGTPATLTLEDNTVISVDGDAIVTGISPLRVFIAGVSAITFDGTGSVIKGTNPDANISVTFATDETCIKEYTPIGGILSIAPYSEGGLSFSGVDVNYENVSLKREDDYFYIDSRCELKVGGTDVTYFNKDNILNDETVSFIPADNSTTPATPSILTLNGASAGAISTSLSTLTVELIGSNTLTQDNDYPVLMSSSREDVTITIQSTGEAKGSLTMNMPYTADGNFVGEKVTLNISQPLYVMSGSLTDNSNEENTVVIGVLDCEFHEGWTTYYNADIDINNLPDGIGVFVVTGLSENAAVVTQINNIPNGVPVLLNNETQTTTTNVFDTDVKNNMLKHAVDAINDVSTLKGTVFGLYNGSFMRVTGSISAGKNYLFIPIPNDPIVPSGAPRLNIVFENDDNMTGISDAKRGNESGQNDEWYTLNGQKLMQKPAVKGLYIKNGKKVVVNNK